MVNHPNRSKMRELERQLERANRIIGWMMPYIGRMCPPASGLADLNEHCCENTVPMPGNETKGAPLDQSKQAGFAVNTKAER